jgi:hypothetical protein
MAVGARVTELAQIGLGSTNGGAIGWIDGRAAAAREQRSELGVSLLHTYEIRRESGQLLEICQPHYADPGFEEHPLSWRMEGDRGLADVGFTLHVACIGVNAALRLGELFDAVAGCFGLDPNLDDAHSRSLEDLRTKALSLDAGTRDTAFDALLRRGEPIHGYAIYTAPTVRPSYQRRAMEAVQRDLESAER